MHTLLQYQQKSQEGGTFYVHCVYIVTILTLLYFVVNRGSDNNQRPASETDEVIMQRCSDSKPIYSSYV